MKILFVQVLLYFNGTAPPEFRGFLMTKTTNQRISYLKDGSWLPWNGEPVDSLVFSETITLKEAQQRYPDRFPSPEPSPAKSGKG